MENAGGGFDAIYTSASYALGAGAEVEWLSASATFGTEAINLTGNELAKTILGNNGANVLNGGGGAGRARRLWRQRHLLCRQYRGRRSCEAGGGFDAVYTSTSYALTVGAEVEWLSTDAAYGTGAINLTGNELGQLRARQ